MAKGYDVIGFAETVETKPGVWTEQITERKYYYEVVRNTSQWSVSQNSTNDNLNISNQISIIADPYAKQHFHLMRYVQFMGTCWKITKVDANKYPRLILDIGGVYNGKQA